ELTDWAVASGFMSSPPSRALRWLREVPSPPSRALRWLREVALPPSRALRWLREVALPPSRALRWPREVALPLRALRLVVPEVFPRRPAGRAAPLERGACAAGRAAPSGR